MWREQGDTAGGIQVMGVQKAEQRERSERDGMGANEGELKGEGPGFQHYGDPRALRVSI